jgi:hypothetical protein
MSSLKKPQNKIDWKWIGKTISKVLTFCLIIAAIGFVIFFLKLMEAAKHIKW